MAKTLMRPWLELRRTRLRLEMKNTLQGGKEFKFTSELVAVENALFVLYIQDIDIPNVDRKLEELLRADPCHCDFKTCKQVIEQVEDSKSVADIRFYLALLYKAKSQIEESLDLLYTIYRDMLNVPKSEIVEKRMDQVVDEAINTLKETQEESLIWKYGKWILEQNPTRGVDIFTHAQIQLGVDRVLKFIKTNVNDKEGLSADLTTQKYLEYMIHEVKSSLVEPQHYTLLSLKYIDLIVTLQAKQLKIANQKQKISIGSEEGLLGELRTKLMMHLSEQNNQSYDTILERLQPTDLHAEKILLYQRLGKHAQALRVYLLELGNEKGAESYCLTQSEKEYDVYDRVYLRSTETNEMLLTLLGICFEDSRFTRFGIELLNKYSRDVDPVRALALVPASIPAQELYSFITHSVQGTNSNRRTAQVVRSLTQMENFQAKYKLVVAEHRKKTIHSNTKCPICNKKIGNTVVIIYPDEAVVHYSCYNSNLNVNPSTGRNFLKEPVSFDD